jgi:hypothetical protein
MRFEHGRGVREDRRGGVELGERRNVEEANSGVVGDDQAMREFLRSWFEGIAILRTISKVVRQRICRRAPLRHATCVAVGDGTEALVAGTDQ